jgi:hypothetical protein
MMVATGVWTMKRLRILATMLAALACGACGDDSSGDDDSGGEETPQDAGGDASSARDARADARADAGNSGGGDEDASEPVDEDAGGTPGDEDASIADAGRTDAGAADAGAADAGRDAGTADAGGGNDCASLTYAAFGEPFLTKYCSSCHAASKMGSARMGAPANKIYDTLAQVKAGKAELKKEVVDDKSMPFGPSSLKPSNAERTQFGAWLACGPN